MLDAWREALGVSRPTIHRMITELRRRGKVIRAIRDTNGWHYEMANEASSSRFRGKKSMRRGN